MSKYAAVAAAVALAIVGAFSSISGFIPPII
jgi:Flp pilus assembly pilin Flp